jgi:hypothetical protein
MGMSVSAEGMAFLARRIVVHTDGRDAEHERRTADIVQALAYHRARAAHHPSDRVKKWSERKSWRLARKVGVGDVALGSRLLDVQRDRVTEGADAALASMFGTTDPPPASVTNTEKSIETAMKRSMTDLPESTPAPAVANPVRMPDPVAVGFLKSALPLKPVPAIAPTPVKPIGSTPKSTVAATSPRPRGATGRVPEAARSPRPKRTPTQLLDEARTAMTGLPDGKVTAEGIRREVHTSPANARMLRDTLLTERAAAVGAP